MRIKADYISIFIWICSFILSFLMLFFSASGFSMEPNLVLFVAILGCLLFLGWRSLFSFVRENYRICLVVGIIIGVIVRAFPLLLNWTYSCLNDLSDTGVHYYGAQELVAGVLEGKIINYEKMFPYLYPYTYMLSIFVRITFGNIKMAIILSNIIFDYTGIFLVYKILKMIKGKNSAMLGMLLAIMNPFSIVSCWIPLNLILVNLFLLAIIYICIRIIIETNVRKTYFECLLLGGVVCIANYFRPVFSVAVIAVIIILVIKYIREKNVSLLIAGCIMLGALMLPTAIINGKINNYFEENIMDNASGWSFFVGSNYESKGQWSATDRDYFFGEIVPYYTKNEARSIIMEKGFERYSKYTMSLLANHVANKMSVLFADEGNAIYDIKYCFGISEDSWKYQLLYSIVSFYFVILTIFNLVNNFYASNEYDILMFLRLLVLGFSASFLLVEVMNRYTFIVYPVLIIISAMCINDLIDKFVIGKGQFMHK